jgi:hypothetical protein
MPGCPFANLSSSRPVSRPPRSRSPRPRPHGSSRSVSRTTGYQTKAVDDREAFVIPRDGKIVAWSVSLGNPDRRQIAFFDDNYGASRARLSVLRRGTRLYGRVRTQSPVESLEPYFGQTVQFPLEQSLAIAKGDVLALTVPTWAPALGLGLGRDSVWRASRAKDACDDTQTQSAQADVRDLTQYKCAYRTARVTYSATLVTTPVPPEPEPTPKPGR